MQIAKGRIFDRTDGQETAIVSPHAPLTLYLTPGLEAVTAGRRTTPG